MQQNGVSVYDTAINDAAAVTSNLHRIHQPIIGKKTSVIKLKYITYYDAVRGGPSDLISKG